MSTCYVGCSPTTTIVGHAPHVAHLAYTGAPISHLLAAAAVVLAGSVVLLVSSHFLNKKGPRI